MNSHLAGVWGALRHTVPRDLSGPHGERPEQPPKKRPGRAPSRIPQQRPGREHLGGSAGRPWLGMVLLGAGSLVSAVRAVVLWRAADLLATGTEGRGAVLAAVASGLVAAALGVAAIGLGAAGRAHGDRLALGAVLSASVMTVLAWLLPPDVKQTSVLAILLLTYGMIRLGDYSPARTSPVS